MEHKSTQFTGSSTVLTVEVSLGELLMIEEILAAAAENLEGTPAIAASMCIDGVSEVIAEAREVRDNFQA